MSTPMRGILFFIWMLIWGAGCNAQQLTTQEKEAEGLVYRIPAKARYFTTDYLQQVYAVTSDNTLIKYSPEGRELFRYNNNRQGQLASVDASNPLNILLFYADYQRLVTLDRTLNETATIDLVNWDFYQTPVVATATDNNLWIYDESRRELIKVDAQGTRLAQSGNLVQLTGRVPQPVTLLHKRDRVWMSLQDGGLLVFSNFGQYLQLLPDTVQMPFQILENQMIYRKDDHLVALDLDRREKRVLPIPASLQPAKWIRLEVGRLFALFEDRIEVWRSH